MTKDFKSDSLGFLLDASFEKTSKDFKEMFNLLEINEKNYHYLEKLSAGALRVKDAQVFDHEGTTINLFPHLPYLPLSKLSKDQKKDCEILYNLGGIVCTPEDKDYELAIPTLHEIYKYAVKEKISVGFPSIKRDGFIGHYDPESKSPAPWKHLERRMRSRQIIGVERREGPFQNLEAELEHIRNN